MSEDKNRATAAALLPLVGGAGNVLSITHCMTRLRLGIRDPVLVQHEALRALPAVLGVVEDDTYQIVLGPGTVARVTPEFERLVERNRAGRPAAEPAATTPAATTPAAGPAAAGEAVAPTPVEPPRGPEAATPPSGPASTPRPTAPAPPPGPAGAPPTTADELAAQGAALKARQKSRNATPAKLFLRRIAQVFVPLIPALIGCGIIAGINGLLANLGWLPSLVPALAALASGFMSLIAVFVGYHTAKEFGGTPILGGAVAAVIVFPGVTHVTAFGQPLAPGQGGVLGALGAALLAVQVEKCCRHGVFPGRAKSRAWGRVPEALDVLVTPTLTVLITGLVTLFGLMYAAGAVSTATGTAATWLLAHGGAFAGFVLGGLFLPLVMLGLHQALIPLHTTLIEQQGYTVLLPILAMAGAGQVGAALAVYLRLPGNRSIRTTIKSALPAGFLGVGEPLIYGVSLPLGRPFITACIGGAFGGGCLGLFNQLGDTVGSTAIGPSGWALFPLVKGNQSVTTTLAVYALGLAAGYLAGFLATYFFGFSKSMRAELNADQHPTAGTAPGILADTDATALADATDPTSPAPTRSGRTTGPRADPTTDPAIGPTTVSRP
ncbi:MULTISPECIES: PTS transporter subunit EIIC [Streptomyces]|uniref:PTS transporter subunit EIIC n=1 Tax=Streptomyces TaxID=1883 RepID=UPI00341D30DB